MGLWFPLPAHGPTPHMREHQMRIVNTGNVHSVNHENEDYEVGDDGVFDVPQDVAEYLLAFPGWVLEYVWLDEQAAKVAAEATEPKMIAARLAQVEARVTEQPAEPVKSAGRPKKTVG